MLQRDLKVISSERTIWLIRHGHRQDSADRTWRQNAARPHDPPLSDDGREQARLTGLRLASEEIDHLFCSPFLRAVQTASVIAAAIDRPMRLEPGLGELHLLAWFPTLPDTIPAAARVADFPRVDVGYEPVHGPSYPESEPQAYERAGIAAQRLVARYDGNLALVGHGGSVYGAVQGLLGAVPPTLNTALCCLVRIVGQPGAWRMVDDGNDISHLGTMPR